jgi:ketosteroid isomerase-like protein
MTTPATVATAESAVARELDDFHDAAAHADEPRYFAHFAPDAVFLGTDVTERWNVAAFRAYAHPHFATGKGWTYHPLRRAIAFAPSGAVAWFDEDLRGERVGPTRGSGVLVLRDGRWLIALYDLSITIPNEKFDAVKAVLDGK